MVRPHELGAPEIDRWREIQRADARLTSPFLAPEFSTTYGRHRREARVAVVEQDGVVTAFLPFERTGRGTGRGLAYRLADCQGVVAAAEFSLSMPELLAGARLAVLEFDHLLAHQAGGLGRATIEIPSPVVDLTDGYAAWVAAKKKSGGRVKRGLEKGRKLGRDVGPLAFAYDTADHDGLDELMRWKSDQYRRTGRADGFARPWLGQFLHDLLDTTGDGFAMRLSRLDAGERTVARYLCARSPQVLASWFPVFDSEFGSYSPGLVSVLSLLESAAADGITTVDLGKGHEDYKQSLKTGDHLVAQGVAVRPGPTALRWNIVQAPRRMAFDVVTRSPKAFHAADHILRRVASVRRSLGRTSA